MSLCDRILGENPLQLFNPDGSDFNTEFLTLLNVEATKFLGSIKNKLFKKANFDKYLSFFNGNITILNSTESNMDSRVSALKDLFKKYGDSDHYYNSVIRTNLSQLTQNLSCLQFYEDSETKKKIIEQIDKWKDDQDAKKVNLENFVEGYRAIKKPVQNQDIFIKDKHSNGMINIGRYKHTDQDYLDTGTIKNTLEFDKGSYTYINNEPLKDEPLVFYVKDPSTSGGKKSRKRKNRKTRTKKLKRRKTKRRSNRR
jgi:hypothetical protein